MTKALTIAKKGLRSCYTKKGIVAGSTHFNNIWARDSFYASWGALELKDYEIVKTNINTFLKNIRNDGLIPIRIGATKFEQILSFLGKKIKSNKPEYNQDKGFNPALDSNTLLIITLDKYLEKTNDSKFAKRNLKKIKLIVEWLESQEKEGLLYGGKYSTWQDAIKKEGYSLYSNVLYYQAFISLSNILKRINFNNNFLTKAEIIKNHINKKFWDKKKKYYTEYFNEKQKSKVFSTDNFFAILFNVTNKTQTNSILKASKKISKDIPSYPNYPRHEYHERYMPFRLIGMGDYTDYDVCWTRIGPLHAMVENKKKGKEILNKLTKLIEKDKEIYEVYNPDGSVMNRLFYKSEKDFAHTAGFYILANKQLK